MLRLQSPAHIPILACVLALWSGVAAAQQLLPPAVGTTPPLGGSPRSIGPAQSLAPLAAAPAQPTPPAVPSTPAGPPVQLALSARYGREAATQINGGLLWRIFPARPDQSGTFRVLREDRSATPVLSLPAGDYVVHVSFGLASAAKAVHLKEATRETFEIPAGGVKLEGRVADVRIPPSDISFDIFKGSQFEAGNKSPVAQGVATGDVVVVPEGNYFIVSNYGDTNAVVRSDIRVQSGKLTDVTVTHRAAVITLKLVAERGGEALANTTWSVITPGGDVVKESTGAFPRVVLGEGDYRAIARNDGHTYERDFKVITGVDGEVVVLAR
jgi:hypothetical protein